MRRLVKWLTNMLLGLLFLLVILLVLLPAVFASRLAVVYSGSMEPVMPVGTVAVMQTVDPTEIKVGDIIAFTQPESTSNVTVSHRVIEVLSTDTLSFQTKGDANEDPDPFTVPASNVLARVTFNVPNLGYILSFTARYTKGRLGFGLFIALPTILIIGTAIRDMNLMTNPRKRRARQRQKLLERRKKRRSRW